MAGTPGKTRGAWKCGLLGVTRMQRLRQRPPAPRACPAATPLREAPGARPPPQGTRASGQPPSRAALGFRGVAVGVERAGPNLARAKSGWQELWGSGCSPRRLGPLPLLSGLCGHLPNTQCAVDPLSPPRALPTFRQPEGEAWSLAHRVLGRQHPPSAAMSPEMCPWPHAPPPPWRKKLLGTCLHVGRRILRWPQGLRPLVCPPSVIPTPWSWRAESLRVMEILPYVARAKGSRPLMS